MNPQYHYDKDYFMCKEIITIQISEYLTSELVDKVADFQRYGWSPAKADIRSWTSSGKEDSDCFRVYASDSQDNVIGHMFCLRNTENEKRWYYGDLYVHPKYQRCGIASKMVKAAINRISDSGGETLCCYVKPENIASISLQKSLGFEEKPSVPFDLLTIKNNLMFEKNVKLEYCAVKINEHDAPFLRRFHRENVDILHGANITVPDFKNYLTEVNNDLDEENYLICHGAVPLAWLKINGLANDETAWISMLAVGKLYQRKGVGTFAVKFSEEYVKSRGFRKIGIHTTEDNIAAQNLYKKCGYEIREYGECTTGDGEKRMGYIFIKNLG